MLPCGLKVLVVTGAGPGPGGLPALREAWSPGTLGRLYPGCVLPYAPLGAPPHGSGQPMSGCLVGIFRIVGCLDEGMPVSTWSAGPRLRIVLVCVEVFFSFRFFVCLLTGCVHSVKTQHAGRPPNICYLKPPSVVGVVGAAVEHGAAWACGLLMSAGLF